MSSNVTFRAAATQCWICSTTLVTVGRRGEPHLPCADDFSRSSDGSRVTTTLEVASTSPVPGLRTS